MPAEYSSGLVLVVDDDPAIRKVLAALLGQSGIEAETAESVSVALGLLAARPFDVVVTDLRMPDLGGMELLPQVVARWPAVPVIVLTAHGSVPLAVEAMRLGAADFILKPFDRDQLLYVVSKALELGRGSRDRVPPVGPSSGAMIGCSARMQEVDALLRRLSEGRSTILVRGETGTGKELVARAVHAYSKVRDKAFVKVDCASLPDTLLESELFGYERGAFTGATCRKPGRVELAQGGTLFLDEIGEITPALQKKLLRLLQDREFERLGGVATIKADVRFVAATHRSLEAMVESGDFREDLFYRLNVVPIRLPPLRERKEDLGALTKHFCDLAAKSNGVLAPTFDDSAVAAFAEYAWPGNVRQLQHLVERLVVLNEGGRVDAARVQEELAVLPRASSSACEEVAGVGLLELGHLDAERRKAERDALKRALERANGNRTLAARILGVSRRTLHYKLKEHEVE